MEWWHHKFPSCYSWFIIPLCFSHPLPWLSSFKLWATLTCPTNTVFLFQQLLLSRHRHPSHSDSWPFHTVTHLHMWLAGGEASHEFLLFIILTHSFLRYSRPSQCLLAKVEFKALAGCISVYKTVPMLTTGSVLHSNLQQRVFSKSTTDKQINLSILDKGNCKYNTLPV